MVKSNSKIVMFAVSAFVLLGVLFGMQIFSFMAGNIGIASEAIINDVTSSQVNNTVAYINATVYTIPEASNRNYAGGFVVTAAYNDTSGLIIAAGNYTVDATAGTITNASATTWDDVSLIYTVSEKTDVKVNTEDINNGTLTAVNNYSTQAGTQFNTIGIAITVAVLILLFMMFWNFFMKGNMGGSGNKSAGNFG